MEKNKQDILTDYFIELEKIRYEIGQDELNKRVEQFDLEAQAPEISNLSKEAKERVILENILKERTPNYFPKIDVSYDPESALLKIKYENENGDIVETFGKVEGTTLTLSEPKPVV